MTPPKRTVLGNRWALLAALAFCIYGVWIPKSAPHKRDLLFIFGCTWAIFIAVSIAARSPFLADRLVFGISAVNLALALIKQIWLPGAVAMSVINGFVSVLWAIAAVGVLASLISVHRRRARS
jgi:hypothetical protein